MLPLLVPPVLAVPLLDTLLPLVDPSVELKLELVLDAELDADAELDVEPTAEPDAETELAAELDCEPVSAPLPIPDERLFASTPASAPPLDPARVLPLAAVELVPAPPPFAPEPEQATARARNANPRTAEDGRMRRQRRVDRFRPSTRNGRVRRKGAGSIDARRRARYDGRMSLAHYVTLGHSGLRVSPLCLGAMTFGEGMGLGLERRRDAKRILDAYVERGGNFIDTANGYTKGHSEAIIGEHLAPRPQEARPRRHRDEVRDQPVPGRPERRRLQPQGRHRPVRRVAPPPAHRLHRSVLAPRLGQDHAHRGDDARARHARRAGQGPLPGLQRHAGVEGGAGADDGAAPRLVSAHRAADRVLAARSARSRASSSRWRRSSASASRRGARSEAAR